MCHSIQHRHTDAIWVKRKDEEVISPCCMCSPEYLSSEMTLSETTKSSDDDDHQLSSAFLIGNRQSERRFSVIDSRGFVHNHLPEAGTLAPCRRQDEREELQQDTMKSSEDERRHTQRKAEKMNLNV